MKYISRIKNAHARLKSATYFTDNYLLAVCGFAAFKLNKSAAMPGRYGDMSFFFRSADVEALSEVLIKEDYKFLKDFLRSHPEPVILDIGHHIGCFSIWALSQNPAAQITGLEADPQTYKIAAHNASLARKTGCDWKVSHHAAWKNDEPVPFSCQGDTMGHKVDHTASLHVDGMSLETLIENIDKPVTLMKVDIEGAEEAFLAGKSDHLKHIENLVIELHPKLCNQEAVLKTLKDRYTHVEYVENTATQKPLLWCYSQ